MKKQLLFGAINLSRHKMKRPTFVCHALCSRNSIKMVVNTHLIADLNYIMIFMLVNRYIMANALFIFFAHVTLQMFATSKLACEFLFLIE